MTIITVKHRSAGSTLPVLTGSVLQALYTGRGTAASMICRSLSQGVGAGTAGGVPAPVQRIDTSPPITKYCTTHNAVTITAATPSLATTGLAV